jgi:hypothetical protein
MLYREIMAVCSEIHTKHINTLCGQNVELSCMLNLDAHTNHGLGTTPTELSHIRTTRVQQIYIFTIYLTNLSAGRENLWLVILSAYLRKIHQHPKPNV